MINYIPVFIAEKEKHKEYNGSFKASVMFLDISGFTSITEQLSSHGKAGAEELSSIINKVFGQMIDVIYSNNGFISTFAGDAFTAIFPNTAMDTVSNCACEIQNIYTNYKIKSKLIKGLSISLKIGISHGLLNWGILGKENHRTFFFKGNSINNAVNAEHCTKPGEILLHGSAAKLLKTKKILIKNRNGFFKLKQYKVKSQSFHPKKQIISKKILNQYFSFNVLNKNKSEFRQVVSVFMQFKKLSDFKKLNEFITTIITLSDNYGGYFNLLDFGDKNNLVLILFGAPISHENNMIRAIDFVLEIKKLYGNDIKAGLSYGTVYAGLVGSNIRATYTVLGDNVNLAARFMSKADWGEIWISENVGRKIQMSHNIEYLGSITFKGKSKETQLYKLLGNLNIQDEFFYSGKFVGRKRESKLISKHLNHINNNKYGGLVYVYGDVGIGKTRIIFNSIEEYKSKSNRIILKTDNILKKSLNPFEYMLKKYFSVNESNSNKENNKLFNTKFDELIETAGKIHTRKAKALLRELIDRREIIAEFLNIKTKESHLLSLDPKAKFNNLLIGIISFIKILSLIKPLIIIIEDLQWMDSDSNKLLLQLFNDINQFPCVFLVSSRFFDNGEKPRLAIKDIFVSEIILKKIESEETEEFVKLQLGYETDKKLHSLILKKTQSNPFFMEQFCLYLFENRYIELKNNIYSLKAVNIDIPSGIYPILISRIDRLSQKLRNLIQSASVLGNEFNINILSSMLSGKSNIKPILKTGEQENLWNAVSQIKYLFKHSLLRDAAYNMQMKKQLKKLHKIAAITMEKVFINNKNFYSDIAFHYEQAEMKNEAKQYLLLAGDFAKENFKNEDAVSLYERLLKYEKKNRKIVSIKMKIGEIYEIIGRWKESIEIYKTIKRIGNKLKNELIIADAENRHGYISIRLGNNEYAIKLFKRALEKYNKTNEKVGISGTYNNYGIAYGNLGNFEKALYYYNMNLLFIEKNEKSEKKLLFDKALTYNNMGLIYQYKGNYSKALMLFNKSKKISNKMGLKRIPALTNIANIQFLKGNLDNAEDLYKKLLIKNNKLGERYVIRILQNNLGSIYTLKGNYSEALKFYNLSYDLAVSIGDKGGIRTVLSNLGDVYFEIGDLSKSLNYLNKALILAKELKEDQRLSTIYFDLVSIYKITGEYKIAIKYLDKVIKKAKALNVDDRLIKGLLCKAEIFYEQKNKNIYKIIKKIEKYSLTDFFKSHSFDIEFIKVKSDILLNNDSAISCLENMLNKYKDDENQAEILFELYRLTNKKSYKIKSLKLYKKLYSIKKSYKYKIKIDILK